MSFKFAQTWCSQCGREFGPGNHGFSHCENHAAIDALAAERDALAAKLSKITRHARKAGKARWKGTTKAERSAAMRKAVLARWSKTRQEQGHE